MEKIIIIDNDAISAAIAKAILTPKYQVETTQSGIQALGYLSRGDMPDMILLGDSLLDMSAIDVLKKLKNDAATADIPVIYGAQNTGLDIVQKCYEIGVADVVTKPILPICLITKVEAYLELEQLRREKREAV